MRIPAPRPTNACACTRPRVGPHRVLPFSSPVSSPTAENGYFVVSITCRTAQQALALAVEHAVLTSLQTRTTFDRILIYLSRCLQCVSHTLILALAIHKMHNQLIRTSERVSLLGQPSQLRLVSEATAPMLADGWPPWPPDACKVQHDLCQQPDAPLIASATCVMPIQVPFNTPSACGGL